MLAGMPELQAAESRRECSYNDHYLHLAAVFDQTLLIASYQALMQTEIARMVEKGTSPLG
jgi:hypothetical protein